MGRGPHYIIYFRKLPIVSSFSAPLSCKSPSLLPVFYNPEMSFSSICEPSLWNVTIKKHNAPIFQSLLEDINLTSLFAKVEKTDDLITLTRFTLHVLQYFSTHLPQYFKILLPLVSAELSLVSLLCCNSIE